MEDASESQYFLREPCISSSTKKGPRQTLKRGCISDLSGRKSRSKAAMEEHPSDPVISSSPIKKKIPLRKTWQLQRPLVPCQRYRLGKTGAL